MSAYLGAVTVTDKHGEHLRVFTVTTLERDGRGREHLGWAAVPARDEAAAVRRVRRNWPELTIMDVAS